MITDSLQRHPFLRLLMPLAGGIVWGDFLPYTPSVEVAVAGMLLGVAMLGVCYRYSFHRLYGAVVFLFLFATGSTLVSRQIERAQFAFTNRAAAYRVTLCESPEVKERSILFRCCVQAEVRNDTLLPYARKSVFLLYFPKDTVASALRRGDEVLIYARLSPPANNGIPDEFDYARHLLRRGVSGTAYVAAGHWQVIGHQENRTLRQTTSDYRRKVLSLYRRLGFRGDELAVLSALTVGDKEELDEDVFETYSVAGAAHVLAISGLHVGCLYMLLFFPFSFLWKRWRWTKPGLLLLIILLLGSFAFFTGLSPSVVRSVAMGALLALSAFQSEKVLTMNTLAVTAFLMLLLHPVWLFDVGFQLSFLSVAAILTIQPVLYRLWKVENRFLRYVWGLVTVSVAAQIGAAPLVMLYFSRFSNHFLLTNLCIIPLVTLIMYTSLLLLLLTPFPAVQQLVATILDALVRTQNAVLRWIERLPFASVDNIWVDAWCVLLFYACLLLACRALSRRTVAAVYMALFALLAGASYYSFDYLSHLPRRSLAFCSVRGCPAVHCMTAHTRSWLVCADSLPDIPRLQRALSPHWNHSHIEIPTVVKGDISLPAISVSNRILFYGGKRVCLLSDNRWRNKRAETPMPVDYLYVSHGYKGDIKELTPLFAIGTVVIDVSLSDYYRERIISDCIGIGIPYLSLSEKGYLRILL